MKIIMHGKKAMSENLRIGREQNLHHTIRSARINADEPCYALSW